VGGGTGRTLHVRCNTWEQVEVFHTRKLRAGKLLSMKVPFEAEVGAQVTLGLELPNQVVMAIDGIVQKASPIAGDTKTWIEVELAGFTEEVVARIRVMAEGSGPEVAPAPAPPPEPPKRASSQRLSGDDLPSDERVLFQQLTGELRKLRQAKVHEVLGVEADADANAVRRGWMTLVRRHHPDLVARHGEPAISHLAEELTILANRAYDRQRAMLVADGRATSIGSSLRQPAGWLVGFEDIASQPRAQKETATPPVVKKAEPPKQPAPQPLGEAAQGGEAFESRARAMLGEGDSTHAQEVLAAALCVYPRSRTLRSLYYVAASITALQGGEIMLATSQLETALAHHDQCREAAQILDHIRRNGGQRVDELGRFFR
jgi:DnaJ-domain-containing protein 1